MQYRHDCKKLYGIGNDLKGYKNFLNLIEKYDINIIMDIRYKRPRHPSAYNYKKIIRDLNNLGVHYIYYKPFVIPQAINLKLAQAINYYNIFDQIKQMIKEEKDAVNEIIIKIQNGDNICFMGRHVYHGICYRTPTMEAIQEMNNEKHIREKDQVQLIHLK